MNNVQSNVTGILVQEKERLHGLQTDISERMRPFFDKATTYEQKEYNGEMHQIGTFHPEMLSSEELETYNRYSKVSSQVSAMCFVFDDWCMKNCYPESREGLVLLTKEKNVRDTTISAYEVRLNEEGSRINVCGQPIEVPNREMSYDDYKKFYLEGMQQILASQMIGLSVEEQNQVIQSACSEVVQPTNAKGRNNR